MAVEVHDQAELVAALAGLGGVWEEIQLHAGTYEAPAGVGYVVPAGAGGCLIRPYPGDETLVVITGDPAALADSWRVQRAATEMRDLISEAIGAGSACYSLNAASAVLTRCIAQSYTAYGFYATTNGHNLTRCWAEATAPALAGFDLGAGSGGSLVNCVARGPNADGIRPADLSVINHCAAKDATARGFNIDRAATLWDCTAVDCAIGVELNNAGAGADWLGFWGNVADTNVIAGTLGANITVGDPAYAANWLSMAPAGAFRNAGADVGVVEDFNGDPRPVEAADLGHLEFQGVVPTVTDATPDGLSAVVVTFDQAMAAGTVTVASEWRIEALISGAVLVPTAATAPTPATVRLAVALDSSTLYRVTAPATAESALGDVVNPAADTADFITGLFAQPARTDPWAFLADATTDMSNERLAVLHQAVILALFADARAQASDGDPLADGNPRGWPGDHFRPTDQAAVGSRLWTLSRARLSDETARKAQDFADEALAHLVTEGLCSRVAVTTAIEANPAGGKRLSLTVRTYRGNAPDPELRFADWWEVFRA